MTGINKDNADTQVKITENYDENKMKQFYLEQIMKSLAELRPMLKSPQYEPLLGPCIDDILKN